MLSRTKACALVALVVLLAPAHAHLRISALLDPRLSAEEATATRNSKVIDPAEVSGCGRAFELQPLPTRLSDRMTLRHASVLIRHGARTRWASHQCWAGDDTVYSCDDTLMSMKHLGDPADTERGAAFVKQYIDGMNPIPGTCFIGQLTPTGYRQHVMNGEALRRAYVDRSGLLPELMTGAKAREMIRLRSTDVSRTLQSGQALVTGLYPASKQSDMGRGWDWWTADTERDTMKPNKRVCPRWNQLYEEARSSPEYRKHVAEIGDPMAEELKGKGIGADTVMEWVVYNTMDCALTHICDGHAVPSEFTSDLVNRISREAAWQQNYPYRYSEEAMKVGTGPLLGEVLAGMTAAINGTGPRLALYSGHDTGPQMPVLQALGLADESEWSPYASMITLELYESRDGALYVRGLYQGSPAPIRGCQDSDGLCKWSDFTALVHSLTPTEEDCRAR